MRSYALTATAIEHDADALAQFDHLLGRLTGTEAQQATHGEVQAMVHTQGSELLRRQIQGHLEQRGSEEPPRERVVGADGSARTQRREGCKRRLETRFGEVIVTRRGYVGRGLESILPLDAELNLPPDKDSHGLREVVLQEVVGGSFDEVVEHLARAGGGRMAKRQAEEMAVHLSQDFDAFYAQPLKLPQASGDIATRFEGAEPHQAVAPGDRVRKYVNPSVPSPARDMRQLRWLGSFSLSYRVRRLPLSSQVAAIRRLRHHCVSMCRRTRR